MGLCATTMMMEAECTAESLVGEILNRFIADSPAGFMPRPHRRFGAHFEAGSAKSVAICQVLHFALSRIDTLA